jgi:hypothetical protein
MTSVTSGKARGALRQGRDEVDFGLEERKKGERRLQIKEEENEEKIGRNEYKTEGRYDAP